MSFKYFDIHIHPVFKTLFRGQKTKISGWTDIDVPDRLLGNCFESQSSLNQLLDTKSKTNLICVGDHAPEMGTLNQWMLRVAAIAVYRGFLDLKRIKQMGNGNISYGMVHTDELRNLLENAPPLPTGRQRKVKVLTKMTDYDENDFDTLHVVFHVEGSHMFYTSKNQCADLATMLNNVDRYLKSRLLLYVTITHLTPNVFCNHAYGNKFLAKGKLLPYKSGLRPFGKALVEKIYSNNVLVDLKHMSWVARKELYEFRKVKGWQNIPLIASHIGLSGFSVKERFNYVKPVAGLKLGKDIVKVRYLEVPGLLSGTHFNPNSINLYEDDILEILKSKGLMGISFDNRILGAADPTELEFVSMEEMIIWRSFSTSLPDKIIDPVSYSYQKTAKGDDEIIFDEEDEAAAEEEFRSLFPSSNKKIKTATKKRRQIKKHLEHFINQLLKIKQVADKYPTELKGINPWDHICIGSDFDGLISALHCCINTKEVENFAKLVVKNIQSYAAGCGITLGMAPDQIVERIFYANGVQFLRNHF
jgi:microsomal dipeptidase-like Zn-dependent dipeptidase